MALQFSFPGPSAVTDQTALRKDLAGLVVRDSAGAARAGVFPRHGNALVSARADMSVDVAAFEGVSVRGGGPLFIANDGVAQVVIAAAPVANSRIDVVYFKQNENAAPYADANASPVLGVLAGTAAGSPVKPSLAGIAGAVELATVLVPAGKTATNQSGVIVSGTHQFTTTSGGVLVFRTNAERDLFTPAPAQPGYVLATSKACIFSGTWGDPFPAQPTRGTATFTTDASGIGYITHGLGTIPSAALVTPAYTNDTVSSVFAPTRGALTSTQIQVVSYRNDSHARLAGTAVVVDWMAWP